jgi:ribosome biogenesis GTPase
MKGLVLRGSWNVFTVRPDGEQGELECRIKGKVLKNMEDYYNPLAPGDRVILEQDARYAGKALILEAEARRNLLTRFNQKGQKSQILAANVDLVLCLTSPASPPFRPRFLDRVLIQAEIAGITPVILCNKSDLIHEADALDSAEDPDTEERLGDYEHIGYQVIRCSAKTGFGLNELRALMKGKTSVLLGQSGVGKSSLINALNADMAIRTGALNEKYNRGNHTTTLSMLLELPGQTFVIDTPGIRRMVPDGIKQDELIFYMREFTELAGRCTYGHSCSHRTEPGCKIMEAVAAGVIHEDRYESFLRIGDELAAL